MPSDHETGEKGDDFAAVVRAVAAFVGVHYPGCRYAAVVVHLAVDVPDLVVPVLPRRAAAAYAPVPREERP